MKKSAQYEMIPNPHGGWSVKAIREEGVIRNFSSEKEAEDFLEEISVTEVKDPSEGVVIDIKSGSTISPKLR
jgi:hypothetical protein